MGVEFFFNGSERSAVEWAVLIVLGTIGILIGAAVVIWLVLRFFLMILGLILYAVSLIILLGPPVLILVLGVWFAEEVGGPLGGLLVLVALAGAVVAGVFWCPRANKWIDQIGIMDKFEELWD